MKRFLKAVTSVGSAALVLSSVAVAAPPGFGQWTVVSGNVTSEGTAGCPATYTCGGAITGAGFFQRQLRDAAGKTYFQTIVTETDANVGGSETIEDLAFYDESFVQVVFGGAGINGIADKQRVRDVVGGPEKTFSTGTTINTGWAGDNLALSQEITDMTEGTEGFRTDFFFASTGLQDLNAQGSPNNMWMKITAQVGLTGTVGADLAFPVGAEIQDFVMAQARGSYSAPTGGTHTINLDGSSLGIVTGDDVTAVWIGQDMTDSVGQVFSFEAYDNLTTAANDGIQQFGLDLDAQSAMQGWDAVLTADVLGSNATDGTGWSATQDFPNP